MARQQASLRALMNCLDYRVKVKRAGTFYCHDCMAPKQSSFFIPMLLDSRSCRHLPLNPQVDVRLLNQSTYRERTIGLGAIPGFLNYFRCRVLVVSENGHVFPNFV